MNQGKFLLTDIFAGIKRLFTVRSSSLPQVKKMDKHTSGHYEKQYFPEQYAEEDCLDQLHPLMHFWSKM